MAQVLGALTPMQEIWTEEFLVPNIVVVDIWAVNEPWDIYFPSFLNKHI